MDRTKHMNDAQRQHLQDSLDRLERLGVHSNTTQNRRHAMQFHTQREASSMAHLCGWNANDALRQDVMGFRVWVVSDPHCNFLTPRGVLRLLVDRGVL